QKHSKYDAQATFHKWNVLFTCPPTKLGAGTIFRKANQAVPTWRADYEEEHGGVALLRDLLAKKDDGAHVAGEHFAGAQSAAEQSAAEQSAANQSAPADDGEQPRADSDAADA